MSVTRWKRGRPRGLAAGFFLIGLIIAWALARPSPAFAGQAATDAANTQTATDAANTLKPGYVGYVGCNKENCHAKEKEGYLTSAHARRTWNDRVPAAADDCEACHGPGQAHMDNPSQKTQTTSLKKMAPQEATQVCLTCHNGRGLQALWAGSQHDQRDVGCIACHSNHSPKGEKQLKAESELEVCGACHRAIVNKQYRFNHMPVREKKLQCSSCHNPHGSANVKLLKVGTTTNEACTNCHPEKRGPVIWEHPPVVEDCATCHDPHGSNNNRLLVAKVPFLCQRCHVTSRHPPTPYEGFLLSTSASANKMYGRGCNVCHQMIHGSNAPAGKAFLR